MRTIDIDTGDIILTSGSSELSQLIQKFQTLENKQYGKFSHSGIAFWFDDILYICEAQKYGICINEFEKRYCNDSYKSILVLKPKVKVGNEIVHLMLPYCGNTRYDYKNLLINQPLKILTNLWIGEKKENTKDFICHEFTTFIYNELFKMSRPPFKNQTQSNAIDICTNYFFTHHLYK